MICYIVGFITSNISQVDKMWSLTPPLYALIYTYHSNMDPRTSLMCVAICIWGIRLTLNFARRGGYDIRRPWSGEEDYRWAYVRKFEIFQHSKILWELFHFGFICSFQHILLFIISTPIQVAYVCSIQDPTATGNGKLNLLDWVLFLAMIGFVIGEGVADQQQFMYQEEKYRRRREKDEIEGTMYEVGFPHRGIWKYCRHPNHFCENMIWLTCYVFSYSASHTWMNWSVIGILTLIALFSESTKLSESITRDKYLKYFSIYEKQVPYFFPNPFNKTPKLGYTDEEEMED